MKDCVSCMHEHLSPMSDTCRECGIAMLNYEEAKPKPITNADRIRAMSDEELAFYIVNHPMWSDESACIAWLKESISGVKMDRQSHNRHGVYDAQPRGETMAEYIDKQKAIDAVTVRNLHPGIVNALQSLIVDIPAADVEPMRHGRWREGAYAGYRCSECRTTWDAPTKFCPNCGADMREVDNGRL